MNKNFISAIFTPLMFLFLFVGIADSENKIGDWTLVQKNSLSLQPDITHYKWEVSLPPYAKHDKIGLHRLINESVKSKGAVFLFPGTQDSGFKVISDEFIENIISSIDKHSNDPEKKEIANDVYKELKTIPDRLITRFLATNGYDVYTMDYRTFYISPETPHEETAFMKEWGWDFFVSDAKMAIDEAKKISGYKKLFLGGQSFGGMLTMNYASRYWQDDLKGLILLDGGNGGKYRLRIPLELWKLVETEFIKYIPELPRISLVDENITPRLLQSLINNYLKKIIFNNLNMYSVDQQPSDEGSSKIMETAQIFLNTMGIPLYLGGKPNFAETQYMAFTDLLADPIDLVTGEYLKPFNSDTGKPCTTYMEWGGEHVYAGPIKGIFTNYKNGYNTPLGLALNTVYNSRHWPINVFLEVINMFEFEITTSNEPIELLKTLGVNVELSQLPEAVKTALKILSTDQSSDNQVKTLLYNYNKSVNSEFDYADNYKNIDIPMLVFESRLGLLAFGPYNPGIKNKDVTNGGTYTELGHIDILTGTTNLEMINKPTLDWINAHTNTDPAVMQ